MVKVWDGYLDRGVNKPRASTPRDKADPRFIRTGNRKDKFRAPSRQGALFVSNRPAEEAACPSVSA